MTPEEKFEELFNSTPPQTFWEFIRYIAEHWFHKGYEAGLKESSMVPKDRSDVLAIKPTKVIIPGPVRQWQQDMLDMVKKDPA